jgi:glutamate carboxypeptidase
MAGSISKTVDSLPDALPMRALLAGARRKQAELLELTTRLVLAESPSDDKAAVDACMDLAAAHAISLGGRVKRHRQRAWGNVLELRFGPRGKSTEKRTLLLGHLDTVWPLGTLKQMPCRLRDGRLWGPGTLDMKAGVAMAFTALEMLTEASLLDRKDGREIILLLNSEEEVGSPISRPITEKLAQECSAVYVLEPAQGLAYKTSRKGTGNWRLQVQGLAAHAGVDFTRGRSAILELVRLIEKVSAWTDLERGTTVNVGVIGGGTKSNVIPADAWAEVDVRVARRADGPRMERRFAALKPTFMPDGCSLTVTGGINRPPMERTRGTVKLFRRAQALAADIGWDLAEAGTGGASDGNFTSALGIATLDGMGAVGEGAHATHESVLLEHLAPRTALLAAMLVGQA